MASAAPHSTDGDAGTSDAPAMARSSAAAVDQRRDPILSRDERVQIECLLGGGAAKVFDAKKKRVEDPEALLVDVKKQVAEVQTHYARVLQPGRVTRTGCHTRTVAQPDSPSGVAILAKPIITQLDRQANAQWLSGSDQTVLFESCDGTPVTTKSMRRVQGTADRGWLNDTAVDGYVSLVLRPRATRVGIQIASG